MSKSKNNMPEVVETEELDKQQEIAEASVETKTKDNKKEEKADKKKDKKKKKEKENKKSVVKKTKETMSELKKVTWPSFGEVVKKTGLVIAFVIIFGLMIFAVDTLLGFLSGLLVG